MTAVRDQLFPQKPPGSRFRFSRTGVQPSPGSSTIELPSAFAESGAYPPDREPPGSPRQCSLPLACRHPPEGHQIGARKRRTPKNTILSQPYCRRVSTDTSDREGSQLAASLEGEPGPTPAGKTLPHSYPETRFRRERARQMPIPIVVTKRYEGQRVTSWRQPATQTNMDPNCDKKLCGSTSNGTDQYQNGSSNLLTPYREQPRSTRNVAAYPRPAFSAKQRKNYAPTSFDQQVQVSQGHTLYRNKKIEIPRSMVVEALSW